MADQDPWERGFEVGQRRRVDLRDPPPDVVRRPPRVSWKILLGALAVVVLIAVGRGISDRDSTGLSADCTKTQLAIGEDSVKSRGPQLVHWAVTAPAGTRFLVAIDAAGSGAHAQADVRTMGKECLERGRFAVLVPPGNYAVTLYRDDANRETQVATKPLVVTK